MKVVKNCYVKLEDMNHHGSLYAGVQARWMTEAAFVGVVRVVHRIDDIVMAAMDHVKFMIPVPAGTVVEFWAGITECGSTSLKIHVEGKDILDRTKVYCSADVIFVNVDHEGKKTPHGLSVEELKLEEENY